MTADQWRSIYIFFALLMIGYGAYRVFWMKKPTKRRPKKKNSKIRSIDATKSK